MSEHAESRRAFLKCAALLGGGAAPRPLPGAAGRLPARRPRAPPLLGLPAVQHAVRDQGQDPERARRQDRREPVLAVEHGAARALHPPPGSQTAAVDAALCPKGQTAIQTTYDPYRIVKVLKRAGKRGENRWVSIPFEQAVAEIVGGGPLFRDVPGEETRRVEGLRDLLAIRDAKAMRELAGDAKKVSA